MKKLFLGVFIFFDVALMGASAFVLYTYVVPRVKPSAFSNRPMTSKPMGTSVAIPQASTSTLNTAGTPLLAGVKGAPSASNTRKILFTYRNLHAKQVSIRADFTGWKGDPMKRSPNGVWTYQAVLTPGEYAYCYTADDKTFKDPANKRSKQIGRTLVSAILVEPAVPKPPK